MANEQTSDLKESSTDTINQRFRLTMDFTLEIHEITKETVRKYYEGTNIDDDRWEFAARQRRLQLALLNNKKILNKFLITLLAAEAEYLISTGDANVFNIGNYESIFWPLFLSMSKEDADYFQETREFDDLPEATEMVSDSFIVECSGVDLTELKVLAEGEVKKEAD
jgi:hypothetical protein